MSSSSFLPPPPPPPIPPRPQSEQQGAPGPPPPLPPLPPGYVQPTNYGHPSTPQTFAAGAPPPWVDQNQQNLQRPHTETPIPAPRPFKVDYEVAGNMAKTLDNNLYSSPPPPSIPYQGVNYTPGFLPSPAPPNPNPQPDWLGWNQNPNVPPVAATPGLPLPYPGPSSPYPSTPAVDNVSQRMANLTFSPPPQLPPLQGQGLTPAQQIAQQARDQVAAEKVEVGGTVPIPTIPSLTSALPTVERPNHDPNLKIVWCRDVFWLVNHQNPSEKAIEIRDPQLLRLFSVAVGMVVQLTTTQTQTPWYAEALYHKASIVSTPSVPPSILSTFPQMKYNPRQAFRDFEASARQGHARAWFKLGRDYESFNDFAHAKDCFERGVRFGQGRCLYRMGIAFLLGQLGVERDIDKALGLLQRAAEKSDLDFPEGGYVWALLLLGEFTPLTVPVPPSAFLPYLPPSLTRPTTGSPNSLQTLLNIASKQPLLTSASLHFAPAQYKLGHAYEFASPSPPFHYDALLSVEWYSKASQGGEVEADMALSKWFLCGAPPSEGGGSGFEKDESLAFTFAERAAKQGLPTALFAMGYYLEVGIGPQGIDIPRSLEWYRRAAETGNEDAKARLVKLEQEGEAARMRREEHEGHLEGKLVRRRTQAKERSDRVQQQQAQAPTTNKLRKDGKQLVDNIRKHTLEYLPEEPSAPPPQAAIPPRGRYASSAHSSSLPPQSQSKPPYPAPNHRYTLADNPPPRRTQSPSRLPVPTSNSAPNSRPTSSVGSTATGSSTSGTTTSSGTSQSSAPMFTPAKPHYPATFAEMGIQGARAEDKECVIM